MTYASVNDERLTAVRLRMPARGAWSAECDFEGDPVTSGRVTLALGKLALSGTVVPAHSGVFGNQRRARIVGGAAAWPTRLKAKAYHNDAGVKARSVVDDLAREIGETIGQFRPAAERIGLDYARDATSAAADVLEDVIGGVPWWVDAAGVTHIGERPTAPPLGEGVVQVLEFDPRERIAVLSVTDPSVIAIGSVITGATLPDAQVVREFQVQTDAASVRVFAWTDPGERSAGRLAGLWQAVTARVVGSPLFGLYTYRVVNMAADGQRVKLQAVHRAIGLPDLDNISQWPGVAGVHMVLVPGAQVLVSFIDGDRAKPIVTHYSGRGGEGFVPVHIVIGGTPAAPAARQGDAVEVLLPPAVFSGTISGAPATGIMTFPLMKTLGVITAGSSKVEIAT